MRLLLTMRTDGGTDEAPSSVFIATLTATFSSPGCGGVGASVLLPAIGVGDGGSGAPGAGGVTSSAERGRSGRREGPSLLATTSGAGGVSGRAISLTAL